MCIRDSGEIDIMEAFNTRSDIQCTIHYPKWNGADQYIYTNKNVDNKTEWHTYGSVSYTHLDVYKRQRLSCILRK